MMPFYFPHRIGAERRRGFTLLELVTAMAIFSIGLLGMVVSFHVGMTKVRAANEMRTAQCIAQNEMERLRALPYAALTPEEKAAFTPLAQGLDRMIGLEAVRTIREEEDRGIPYKKVILTVRWRGDLGRPMKTALVTLISDKGA